MKKYVIGGIAGFLMATALSAHAAEITTIVGKTIQGVFPFRIEGKTLDTPAIVVDGTSYLPIRAFGEATGYDASFDADLGVSLKKKVELTSKPAPTPTPQPEPQVIGDPSAGHQAITSVLLSRDDEKTKKSTGHFDFIQVDGSQYVSLATLGGFYTVSWSEPMVELKLDGKLVTLFPTGTEYSKGTSAFTYGGTVYVNLSLLGLKGIVNGENLVLTEDF
ncbi:hypothetical protein [Paenibacillus sp. SI8]|uniref:hypothetical protein n=1 Tax=unclassified Paenibacillus TaxID=185978 RepID=UPI003466C9FE